MSVLISSPSNTFKTKTPSTSEVTIDNPTKDVYHTILNIQGQGILKRLSVYLLNGDNNYLKIRMTFDGQVIETNPRANPMMARGLGGMPGDRSKYYDIIGDIVFRKRLIIEVLHTYTGSTQSIFASIDYSLS